MSSNPTQPGQQQAYFYQPPPTNALGIAGFVVSLSGMIVCLGLTCPIGLILSLIAMTKAPRGYAVAGSILGGLGSILGVLTVLVVSGVIGSGLFGSMYYSQTQYIIDSASTEIDTHFSNNQDTLPDTATGNTLITAYLDEWGHTLSYAPMANSTQGYTITSKGADGILNTSDDIVQSYTAQTQTDIAMDGAYWAIDSEHTNNGKLPDDIRGNTLINPFQDAWGNAIRYQRDPNSNDAFELTSSGPDGQFGTGDDITHQHAGLGPYGAIAAAPITQEADTLNEQAIASAFDLAAKKIIDSFPPQATLPTPEQVDALAGVMVDPWQTPLKYSPTDNPPIYHLKSAGPDRQWDTSDDLTRSFYFAPSGGTDGPL